MTKVSVDTQAGTITVTHTGDPPPIGALPSAPSYITASGGANLNLPVGHWAAFSQNVLADVDPADDPLLNPNYPGSAPWKNVTGQQAVLSVWCGGAILPADKYGTHGGLVLFGGGHNGYSGSEVYVLNFGTRLFERKNDPYDMAVGPPYATGLYPDGSAVPQHTYDAVGYHPGTHSFVHLSGCPDPEPSGSRVPVSVLFSFNTNTWRQGATDPGGGHAAGMCSTYDPVNDCFWFVNRNDVQLRRFYDIGVQNGDGSYGKYEAKLSLGSISGYNMSIDAAMAYEPTNKLLVVTNYRYNASEKSIRCFDLSNFPTVTYFKPIIAAGAGPVVDQANGWEWCQSRNSFIYFADYSMSEVWELIVPTGNVRTEAWRWNLLTSPENTVTPVAPTYPNGIYSKFNVIRYADMEIAMVVTNRSDPAYLFRLT